MTTTSRRTNYRRYSDRRVAVMLQIHEIIFEQLPEAKQSSLLLEVLLNDFQTHTAAIVSKNKDTLKELTIKVVKGTCEHLTPSFSLKGEGIEALMHAHEYAEGAITLARSRRPSLFDPAPWEALWSRDMGFDASALLSVQVRPKIADPFFIWLLNCGTTLEWSSHDRMLTEEIATLLGRDADKRIE